MEHDWDEEEVDGGPVGSDLFWYCRRCGANGGVVNGWELEAQADGSTLARSRRRRPESPWFSDPYKHHNLPSDCEESQRLINEVKATAEYQKNRLEDYIHSAQAHS